MMMVAAFMDSLARCSLTGARCPWVVGGGVGNGRNRARAADRASSVCAAAETFQRLVEGKVVLCPTNHAMEASFLSTGLLSSVPGDVVQLVEACKSLEALLPRLAVAQVGRAAAANVSSSALA